MYYSDVVRCYYVYCLFIIIDIINYTITVDTDCWALCDYY